MAPFSKLIAARLAANASAPSAAAHPAADTLCAFAENKLPSRDRQATLAHLAICPECREVLSLAQTSQPRPTPRVPRFAWPAIAAATALAATGVFVFTVSKPKELPPVHVARFQPPALSQSPKPAVSRMHPKALAPKVATAPPSPVLPVEDPHSMQVVIASRGPVIPDNFLEGQIATPIKQTEILAISTDRDEIWAGGTAGILFHSTDNGHHWRQIRVSDGTTQISGPILQISRDGQQINLKTPSETWTSFAPHTHWHKQ